MLVIIKVLEQKKYVNPWIYMFSKSTIVSAPQDKQQKTTRLKTAFHYVCSIAAVLPPSRYIIRIEFNTFKLENIALERWIPLTLYSFSGPNTPEPTNQLINKRFLGLSGCVEWASIMLP